MSLKRISEPEFFQNTSEFREYFAHRKVFSPLDPFRQITLLRSYFEGLVFLKGRGGGMRYILPSGGTYELTFHAHTSDNEPVAFGYTEMAARLIEDIAADVEKTLSKESCQEVLELFSDIITDTDVEQDTKLDVLVAERLLLNKNIKVSRMLRRFPMELPLEYFEVRKQFLTDYLSVATELDPERLDALYTLRLHYVQEIRRIYIANGRIFEGLKFLDYELKQAGDDRILGDVLFEIIKYNNLFLLRSKDEIEVIVDQIYQRLSPSRKAEVDRALEFDPAGVDIRDTVVKLEDHRFNEVDLSSIVTIISFVVPVVVSQGSRVSLENGIQFEFVKLTNLFDDPIFEFLDFLDLDMDGMPMSILSDSLPDASRYTAIYILLQGFVHPDFELIDGNVHHLDFAEQEALAGRSYYPLKEKAVEILRSAYLAHKDILPSEIERELIDINFISNFVVNYRDPTGLGVFHKVHILTNLDTYLRVKTRYRDKISQLNLESSSPNIRRLFEDPSIRSGRSLSKFVFALMNLVVKKPIEDDGIRKFLWNPKLMSQPITEPDAQPLILSHLRYFLVYAGIQISREIVTASGRLDFLCSYTENTNLHKVGIEMKNAHHKELVHGLTMQFPEYLDGEGTKYGIFLVLWYKGADYLEPTQYDSIATLIKALSDRMPHGYHINIMAIDCSEKLPPSKLKQ